MELVYFEFRELIVDLITQHPKIKDLLDPKKSAKGIKGPLTKFLDEYLLKRWGALIRHQTKSDGTSTQNASSRSAVVATASRKWPESEKDKTIRLKREEQRKKEEEERKH